MPRKKKGRSTRNIILVVILIGVISFGVIAWHDGLIGITPMGDINDLSVDSGTTVRMKGEITAIVGPLVTASDGTGGVVFDWTGPIDLNSIVVITGVVGSAHIMQSVSAVDIVWIFT